MLNRAVARALKSMASGSPCSMLREPLRYRRHLYHRMDRYPKGELNANEVSCPWHGARFDVTSGSELSPPAPRGWRDTLSAWMARMLQLKCRRVRFRMLCVARTRSAREIVEFQRSTIWNLQVLQRLFRDRIHPLTPRCVRALVRSRADLALEILALRQGRRPQTEASSATLEGPRPPVLDCSTSPLARLETGARVCEARHRRRLASGGLRSVLALAIAASPRQTSSHCRTPRAHSSLGTGECRLGSAQNPR